jgi:hypothetical protein
MERTQAIILSNQDRFPQDSRAVVGRIYNPAYISVTHKFGYPRHVEGLRRPLPQIMLTAMTTNRLNRQGTASQAAVW